MRRLCLLLLFVLLLAGCAFEVRQTEPGRYLIQPWRPLATPTATATPAATDTLTATPSATPTPVATVTSTASPTPSPTPQAPDTPQAPTPTPEGPTVTPGPPPTVTIEPKPSPCEGVVINGAGLNVRADHSTNAALRGILSADAVAIIDAFHIVTEGKEEWAHLVEPVDGWVAAIYYNGRRLLAWPEDVTDGERAIWCLPPYVEITWAENPPLTPVPQARNPTGLHLIFSAPREPVLASLPALGTIKATDGAEWALVEGKKRRGASITTVYRVLYTPWGKLDCPPGWGVGDPVKAADAWYDMLHTVWASRGLLGQVAGPDGQRVSMTNYFEYRNECRFVGQWEVAFDRQMLRRASAAGICLLAFSDAPGTPELAQFAQRRPVLDEMLTQPCRPGARHGIALHTYFGHNSGPWLFGRWQLFRQVVGAKYDALAYWFTEYGMPNTEGQADGRGVPDCGAIWDELLAVDAIFRNDSSVAAYHAYSVGGGTEWLDLSSCLFVLSASRQGRILRGAYHPHLKRA